MKFRQAYFEGYMAALQDVVRQVDEDTWVKVADLLCTLTANTIRDIIRETQIEDTKKVTE